MTFKKEVVSDEYWYSGDSVAILVGPNGAGKSFYLQGLATKSRRTRQITIISNTPYGRLNGLRRVNKFSGGRSGTPPAIIIKQAIAKTLDKESSEFYQLSAILEYCHYKPRFGFRLRGADRESFGRFESLIPDYHRFFNGHEELEDFMSARRFVERWDHDDVLWIDQSRNIHEFTMSREFAAVIRSEKFLKKSGIIDGIEVYLTKEDGAQFELRGASSGELSLICSMIFLATSVEEGALVLIDEPENSLHPSWQREYVGKIFSALGYRNAQIVIASHSPMLVTGAVIERPDLVSVYEVKSERNRLSVERRKVDSGGIESILWKIFDVVTPENHFISENLVEAIDRYERDQLTKQDVIDLIDKMQRRSFDNTQIDFFSALRGLVDRLEARKNNLTSQKGGI